MAKVRTPKAAVKYSIELLGGIGATAREFKISEWAVNKWLLSGEVPPRRVKDLAYKVRAAGGNVSCYELRPDVFDRAD